MDQKPKKVFDISPPKTAIAGDPKGAPTITELAAQHHKMMVSSPKKDEPATLVDSSVSKEEVVVTRKGATISPPSESEAIEETPSVPTEQESVDSNSDDELSPPEKVPAEAEDLPLPEAPTDKEQVSTQEETPTSTDEDDAPEAPASDDKQVPVSEPFGAIDGLPDTSQKATAGAVEAMQSPKIFDTKAYYVPIGNTQHTHGHLKGSIIAGFVTAIIVLGLLFALLQLK